MHIAIRIRSNVDARKWKRQVVSQCKTLHSSKKKSVIGSRSGLTGEDLGESSYPHNFPILLFFRVLQASTAPKTPLRNWNFSPVLSLMFHRSPNSSSPQLFSFAKMERPQNILLSPPLLRRCTEGKEGRARKTHFRKSNFLPPPTPLVKRNGFQPSPAPSAAPLSISGLQRRPFSAAGGGLIKVG